TDRKKSNRNTRIAYINIIKNGDKKLVSRTLEYIEGLENKLILMTSFDKSYQKRFITNIKVISTFTNKNNIKIDVVKTICHNITEEMIMNLEYNNLLLSYVIDFSNLPKEIKDVFDKQVLIAMTASSIKFYRDMDPTSEKYLEYLYENQQTENIKFEKETHEQLDRIMAPFLTSSQAKKADTWIEMIIAKNLHEIVFAETSESPFQATCTTKKVYNDKCKLIHFGYDSKNKMLDELIEKKCIFLSDWKNLCNDIRKAELLLFQAYKAKLKVLVLDCPAHPFCHVREVFDLDIPYKKVVIEEFKLFIQAL
ncbi:17458_t:CDS:2, partial [Racocetra persica]